MCPIRNKKLIYTAYKMRSLEKKITHWPLPVNSPCCAHTLVKYLLQDHHQKMHVRCLG